MRTPSSRRGLPAIVAALLVLCLAPSAHAGVDVEMTSILGEGIRPESEALVRVRNTEHRELHGTVTLEERVPARRIVARMPFVVGPGATSQIKVPVPATPYGVEITAVARDDAGKELARTSESSRGGGGFVLLEIPSRDTHLLPFHVDNRSSPVLRRSGAGTTVTTASSDPSTGAHVLPDRPSSYAHVSLVLVAASELETLAPAERDVLVAWVKGGGALALAVREPADLARPTLAELVGAGVHAVPFEAFAPKTPAEAQTQPSPDEEEEVPAVLAPAVEAKLSGFAGGRLVPSRFGAVAEVGLGNVNLLAIDPWSKEANGDRWVQTKIVELVAEQPGRAMSGHTGLDDGFYEKPVLHVLDANESFRPALVIGSVLLLFYAVGVIALRRLARRGKAFAMYRWTLVASAVTFSSVVGIGLVAKGGFGSRSRQLALVEVASGETVATQRSFRSFYSSRTRVIDVAESAPRSSFGEPASRGAVVATSASGTSTLEHVTVRPWETVVVREDATIPLGQGITIAHDGAELVVTNRSGVRLRDAVVSSVELGCLGLGSIADGAVARTRNATRLDSAICGDVNELPSSWRALHSAFAGRPTQALPGRPTLLGELERPVTTEPGFRIDHHTVLVRVVGGAS